MKLIIWATDFFLQIERFIILPHISPSVLSLLHPTWNVTPSPSLPPFSHRFKFVVKNAAFFPPIVNTVVKPSLSNNNSQWSFKRRGELHRVKRVHYTLNEKLHTPRRPVHKGCKQNHVIARIGTVREFRNAEGFVVGVGPRGGGSWRLIRKRGRGWAGEVVVYCTTRGGSNCASEKAVWRHFQVLNREEA